MTASEAGSDFARLSRTGGVVRAVAAKESRELHLGRVEDGAGSAFRSEGGNVSGAAAP